MSAREPAARAWHAAVGAGDKLFVWAGCGRSIQTTTFESFDVSSLTWQYPQQLNGSLPDGLHNAAVTSDGENFYSAGGDTKVGRINRVYKINPGTLQCKELLPNSHSHAPKEKEGSRSVCFNNKLVVYGGWTKQGRYTDDLHTFDLEKGNKAYLCICYDPIRNL